MSTVTKEDLIKKIEELEAQNAELKNQIAARDAALVESAVPGWLISSPNPGYNGVTYGIEFKNGRAFIPATAPDAERTAIVLVNDFGYMAREMGADDFKALVAG